MHSVLFFVVIAVLLFLHPADNRQQTAGQQDTHTHTDNRQQTTDNRQQATDNRQLTADNQTTRHTQPDTKVTKPSVQVSKVIQCSATATDNSSRTYLVTLMAINTDSRELGPVKASL